MLAHSARLQLPEQPLHIPTWRQAGCLTFHLQLSHVLHVGHLQPLKAWRSLLYPSAARLPMWWGVTDLPLPMYVLLGKAPRCHDTLMYSHMYRASTATARLKT